MIVAIGMGEGVTLAMRDPRAAGERRRPASRRPAVRDAAERIEIDDALAAVEAEEAPAPDGGATVTAALIGRRLRAAPDRGLATQARLGAGAVRRLIGVEA